MSVSINIMHATPSLPFLNQYRFDVKTCEIVSHPQQELDRGAARARRQSWRRQCARSGRKLRGAAIPATASASPRCASWPRPSRIWMRALERLERGAASANRFVAAMSAHELARLRGEPRAGSSVKGQPPQRRAARAGFLVVPHLDLARHDPFDAGGLIVVISRLLGVDGVAHGIVMGFAPGTGERGRTIAVASHVCCSSQAP